MSEVMNARALKISCPLCQAKKGEACVPQRVHGLAGKVMLHRQRIEQAVRTTK